MQKSLKSYAEACEAEELELIRALCAIPAPSGREDARAAFCKTWLERQNVGPVRIDGAKNVICGDPGDGGVVILMAHTDTVFPDLEPLPLREDAEKIFCPGVCDDTANLAALLLCARCFAPSRPGVLFVANSCEEGLGNLRGARALSAAFGSRIQAVVSLDGFDLLSAVNRAVGSHRWRVTVRTEGGHSFGSFGNRNAIRCLSALIDSLYTVKVPEKPGTKTTYNVGTISGGTSVNTIAQEAEMLWEYRSDDRDCLGQMETVFEKMLDAYRATGIEIQAERIGERPCSGAVDPAVQSALENRLAAAFRSVLDREPTWHAGSTDCNIPLSLGIPALCFGACRGGGAHTREEYLEKNSLKDGLLLALTMASSWMEE